MNVIAHVCSYGSTGGNSSLVSRKPARAQPWHCFVVCDLDARRDKPVGCTDPVIFANRVTCSAIVFVHPTGSAPREVDIGQEKSLSSGAKKAIRPKARLGERPARRHAGQSQALRPGARRGECGLRAGRSRFPSAFAVDVGAFLPDLAIGQDVLQVIGAGRAPVTTIV
jgi:hypothetical protein